MIIPESISKVTKQSIKIILEMDLSAQSLFWIQQLLETLEYRKGMTDCTISTQFVPLNCSFRFPSTGQSLIDTH